MRDWLSLRVTASPDKTALVRAADGESWTYGQLDDQVEATAGRLAAIGVQSGDHVGVLLSPGVGYVGLIHAVMRLGATLVPLGPRLTAPELRARVDAAEATLLICENQTESLALSVSTGEPVVSVGQPEDSGVAELRSYKPMVITPPDQQPDDRLCIVFTSGTTGEPKPVDLRYRNVRASAVASGFRLGIDPDERWLVTLSPHHMGGLAPIYRSVLYGTTVVMRDSFDPGGTADDIDRLGITVVSLVPTMLRQMLDRRGTLDGSLRAVLLGGAPSSDQLIERCRDFSVPVCPTYGMTETASQITTAVPGVASRRLNTVGRPLMGTEITVVARDGTVRDRGESGELVVSGPTVTPGYYGDPEATDEKFGDHGLHTGDIGYIDEDGYVHVLNRLDDRIISGGENIQPGEVAAVLTDHPQVKDAAVVGIDDEEWGQRVGAQVARVTDELDAASLLSFAQQRLARFKLPRTLSFAAPIQRTASGTIDRPAVRDHLSTHGFQPGRSLPEPGEDGFKQATPRPTPTAEREDSDGASPNGSVETTDSAAEEPTGIIPLFSAAEESSDDTDSQVPTSQSNTGTPAQPVSTDTVSDEASEDSESAQRSNSE